MRVSRFCRWRSSSSAASSSSSFLPLVFLCCLRLACCTCYTIYHMVSSGWNELGPEHHIGSSGCCEACPDPNLIATPVCCASTCGAIPAGSVCLDLKSIQRAQEVVPGPDLQIASATENAKQDAIKYVRENARKIARYIMPERLPEWENKHQIEFQTRCQIECEKECQNI